MTVSEFDAAYFYASDLKSFASEIGIKVGNFRKIELENLIRDFLTTGTIPTKSPVLPRKDNKQRDELMSGNVVVNYVGDRKTKNFLLELVHKHAPNIKDKSGQWYWLNDWRRQQQEAQNKFTYADIADKLRSLMQTQGRLPQIPSARMNNFVTEFLADPSNPSISRQDALAAWEVVKTSPGEKTYERFKSIVSKK